MNEIIPKKNERILEKSGLWVFGIIGSLFKSVIGKTA